jgi:hypothetical protein
MLIRTTPLRTTLAALAALLFLSVPAFASAAPADDLAALLAVQSPVECAVVSEPGVEEPTPVEGGNCDQWYTVNDYARKLVRSCDTATQADYDEVTAQALINTNNFGTQVCANLGCTHTASGADPEVKCSCKNRILLCSVNMEVYCD